MATDAKTKRLFWVGGLAAAGSAIWAFSGRVHDSLAGHVNLYFVSRAEAQTMSEQIKGAVETAKNAAEVATETSMELFRYIRGQELMDERSKLERLRGEFTDTELWESQNGANALSRSRKSDIGRQIGEVEQRIRCLEDPGRPGC